MPDQNPIYDFMKSNNLTDLDEKSFINKYSAPDKAKEIYGFMASNKLTDLDETKFYDKYLKKKVGGEEFSLTQLPSEYTDVLKKGVSPNPTQEEIKAARLLGVKPSKGLAVPTNITADQKAYERELKRQDAAINTLKNTYSKKGLKFDEKSKRGQEQIVGLLEKEKNNDLSLVTGKDQKPYLVRGEGFLESAGKGLLRSIIDPIESTRINTTNDPNELADLLDEKIAEEPNVPSSAPTKVGGYLGELAGGLPKLMALLSIPYVGEAAMVSEMYHNGLANQRRALYEQGLADGLDRETSAKNAMQNAPITAIPDAVVGAALARGPGGKAAGREIIPNAAKESFLSATGKGIKGVAKVSAIGGTAEYGRSKTQQKLGYDVTDAEAIENGLRGMGDYALMDAAFKLAHVGPKYLSSAAKNLLSTVPKEVLEVAAEKYPDGQRTLDEVAKFTETKATVQDFVPEEKVAAVTGLTEKVQNLEKNIKELEEKKKTSSQALHPFMDGWIKEYQDEIDFYKKQVDKVVKSKDPTGIVEEIDDVTGLKAGEKPIIQEEAVVTEEVKPTEVKIEDVTSKQKDEKFDAPTLKSPASNYEKLYVPKKVIEEAYKNDKGNNPAIGGGGQSLETIIRRGGYSIEELNKLLPNWKEIASSKEVKPTEVKETIKLEAVPEQKLNQENRTYTTKTGKQRVEYENGQLIVRDIKTGKEVSDVTRRKAIDEYVESFDFGKGERFNEVVTELPSRLNEEEGKRYIVENSKNPLEVIEMYVVEPKESKLTTEEQMIADYGLGKLTQAGFERFGDENLITGGMAKTYFNKEGTPIDVRAKEMSDYYGKEITPQDIVNFMIAYPSGASQAVRVGETRVAREAAERFKELTGIDLNSKVAERIIDAEIAKAEAFEQELIKQEYETREQLEEEYYRASAEADRLAEEGNRPTAEPAEKTGTIESKKEVTLQDIYEGLPKSEKLRNRQVEEMVDKNFDSIIKQLDKYKIC